MKITPPAFGLVRVITYLTHRQPEVDMARWGVRSPVALMTAVAGLWALSVFPPVRASAAQDAAQWEISTGPAAVAAPEPPVDAAFFDEARERLAEAFRLDDCRTSTPESPQFLDRSRRPMWVHRAPWCLEWQFAVGPVALGTGNGIATWKPAAVGTRGGQWKYSERAVPSKPRLRSVFSSTCRSARPRGF